MSTKFSCLLATVLSLAFAASAAAQGGPTIGIEPIVATLTAPPTTPPPPPPPPPPHIFEQFYPNHFDLTHPKKLTFEGLVTNGSLTAPAFVDLWFDWIDPRDPVGTPPRISGVFPIDIPAGGAIPIGLPGGPPAIMFTIPFCPPEVSIHIQNNGPSNLVVIDGRFIHECLIPEPATGSLLGIGLLGIAGAMRRRRTC